MTSMTYYAAQDELVAELRLRIAFYESVMQGQPPHEHGHRCRFVEAVSGLHCCNPKCNGEWGTGCWCCHHLDFAIGIDPETMKAHLALASKPVPSEDQCTECLRTGHKTAECPFDHILGCSDKSCTGCAQSGQFRDKRLRDIERAEITKFLRDITEKERKTSGEGAADRWVLELADRIDAGDAKRVR
jgi:hypothetical protein